MVSLIGWIVTTGSCEDSVSKIVDEPGCVETTCAYSSIWEDDASPYVLTVLVSVERCRLHRQEVTFGGKCGFNASLREQRGKGLYSSKMIDLFYDQK